MSRNGNRIQLSANRVIEREQRTTLQISSEIRNSLMDVIPQGCHLDLNVTQHEQSKSDFAATNALLFISIRLDVAYRDVTYINDIEDDICRELKVRGWKV